MRFTDKARREPFIYGAVVAGAVFFAGWSTGMGGSFWPNLIFSLVMGVFGGGLYMLVKRMAARK